MTTLNAPPGASREPMWKRYVHGHHWRTSAEEFDGLKLGFWLFLTTEVLLFGGIFCAYFIFRTLYPAAWAEGSQALNWKIGCFNTAVLLISSYTMAASIYCIQTDQQKRAQLNLLITLLCGALFVGIKLALEYLPKWSGFFLIWDPALHHHTASIVEGKTAFFGLFQFVEGYGGKRPGALFNYPFAQDPHVPLWWSVYYCGTAIHALHVLIGMALIFRVYVLSRRGFYGPTYYTGVEITGLYWHLVDLIWIFLFPLLYLVH
jgi:cytochrome c oxidase subunit III